MENNKMKITNIESVASFTKVSTDEGITGYAYRSMSQEYLDNTVKPVLVGKDACAIEEHLQNGLINWPSVEHALWDVVGKAAGMPVYKLLGGDKDKIKAYLTCVWTGKPDQSDITPEQQAEQAAIYLSHGYKAMKIRAWRLDPMDDVAAVKAIKDAVGDKMEIMIDRTAQYPGWIWDYGTAYRFAREIEALGATWLEEPFYRGDVYESARLAEVVDIPITGGEGDRGLEKFREYLVHGSFDIVQPDGYTSGGILTIKKIGAMAEAFGKECILHGSNGFGLAPGLQISAALPNCRLMEIALVSPPLLPEEHWEEANKLIKNPPLYEVEDGYIKIPEKPGLGIELNEEALR